MLKTSHPYKTVEWSYATSTNAKRFGFYRTGCYTVSLTREQGGSPKALASFAKREDAVKLAQTLPEEWSPMHLRFHPEDGI